MAKADCVADDEGGARARRVSVLAFAATSLVLALGGCGSGGSASSETPSAAQEEQAESPEAAAGQAKQARTPSGSKGSGGLRLLDKGNPTVFLKIDAEVDLYDEPGGDVVERVGDFTEFGSRTVFSVVDQERDWASVLTPATENGEPLWLELDPKRLKAGQSVWNLEVDLSEFETRLFKDGKLVRTFAVSVGMPTAPTPTGRFAITDTFRGDLDPTYGCCALATTARQVNLPSGWLGGDRIAFHGTSGPLRAEVSNGCVRAADKDVSALVDIVPPGTPVEIHQ